MNRKQRRAAPKAGPATLPQAAAGIAARQATAVFQSAQQLHQAGRLQEAESLYRNVLALVPSHAGALNYLGVLTHQLGHSEAGIAFIRQAIAADRQDAEPRYSLGLIYAGRGEDAEAITQNRKALKLNPAHAEAHTNLGILLLRQAQTKQATQHLAQAVVLNPSPIAYENLAQALLEDQRPAEALDVALRGLTTGAGRNLKSIFAMIAKSLDPAQVANRSDFRDAFIQALHEPWCRPRDLARQACAMALGEPGVAESAQRVMSASPNQLATDEILDRANTPELYRNALLLALMQATPVMSLELERLLTAIRQALLSRYASQSDSASSDLLSFTSALAQQCFINEYVFDVQDDEAHQAQALHDGLSANLTAGQPSDPLLVALSACYAPLHTLTAADQLTAGACPAPIQQLIAQQVLNHRTEQELRATIPALTPIEDATSATVRQQYEENPYPRWSKIVSDQQPLSIDQYIRTRFPHAPYRPIEDGSVDMLVAGCGTGMHAIERGLQFKLTDMLAIDLSLGSLSYAMRKTREAKLANIKYAQADIMALRNLGRQFAVVDASGVLHHMRDPFEGWRVLASLVRPGGLMYVALYSATARQDIRAVRDITDDKNYPSTPAGIRALRRDIVSREPADPLRRVADFPDFFSASECRDLLMHVEEHQLSLPEIAAFLDAEGFELLGFETRAEARYRQRFPNDVSATNLANWARFESENPMTFAEMYQFWIQKRPDATR